MAGAEKFGGAPGCITFVRGAGTEVWWCPYRKEHFLMVPEINSDTVECPQCGHSRRERKHLFICSVKAPPQ